MTDQLRRLLQDLADDAPQAVDAQVVRRAALRRQATALGAAASLLAVSGVSAAMLLASPDGDTLQQQAGPASSTPVESGTAEPTPTPMPTATQPAPEPSTAAETPSMRPSPTQTRAMSSAPTKPASDVPQVAWQPQPVPPTGPDPARATAPSGLRRCAPTDLRFRVSTDFATAEAARRTLIISGTSVADSECGLDDHGFGITFPDSDVRASSASTADARPDTLVRPGDRLVLVGFIVNWCSAERGPVRIALNDGQNPHAVAGRVTPPSCAAATYGSEETQTGAGFYTIAPAGSPLLLAPRLRAPREATAGQSVRYDVELLNTSDTSIQFDPCPGFTHVVGDLGSSNTQRRTSETHRLPCAAMPTKVDPGQRIIVAGVRAPVPDVRGSLLLGWSWGTPDASSFGAIADGVRGVALEVR